ncbi:MAG: histidinol-phosphate transaminase [Terriglobales bacterium]|jgi:histidinol-phosphate aminotransferase|nr:histidinol-phosphate transaminase [Terriglobales bacterium]
MLNPREAVRKLKSYHPPLGNRQGLRLDFNENTVGCSPRVMQRLRKLDAEQLARYPEREPLEAVVASHLGIRAEELLLTNGTDEAIHLVCETYLEPGDEALIVVPTFSMYEIYAAATGAKVIAVPAAEEFRFPLENVIAHINERTRLIAVANPNNPTGTMASRNDLLKIAEHAPNSAILIDEAYFEFCGETLLPEVRTSSNLFVSRTFSKAYGLAGLRIGILAGHQEQIHFVRPVSSPYNVNSIALACLPDALGDQEYVQQYVDEILAGRNRLERELQDWGIKFWPSRANFVLMHFGSQASAFISAMREKGILVRDRSSDHGCVGCVRITLGSKAQTDQMLTALRETFEQIAIRQQVRR